MTVLNFAGLGKFHSAFVITRLTKKAGGNETMGWPLGVLEVLRARGLEPLTFGSVDRCSIQLSYARTNFLIGHIYSKLSGNLQVSDIPSRFKTK